jgi:hypothetical protein
MRNVRMTAARPTDLLPTQPPAARRPPHALADRLPGSGPSRGPAPGADANPSAAERVGLVAYLFVMGAPREELVAAALGRHS